MKASGDLEVEEIALTGYWPGTGFVFSYLIHVDFRFGELKDEGVCCRFF